MAPRIEHLDALMASGTNTLCLLGERVWVAIPDAAIPSPIDGTLIVLDLQRVYERLQLLIGGQSSWSLRQLALVAGTSYEVLSKWEANQVIDSGGRNGRGISKRYDFSDFFACACLGELRKRGVSLVALARVYRLLTGHEQIPSQVGVPINED